MTVILSSGRKIRSRSIPPCFRTLPDGRPTADVIARLDSALRGAGRPTDESNPWTHQAELHSEIYGKYGQTSADTIGVFTAFPDDIGICLDKITIHAGARMWASGNRGSIWHGQPRQFWNAAHLSIDAPAILLAVCELLRNDNRAIADWYLSASCGGLCELHKSDSGPRACGSDSCGRASDETPCVCACGGVNHGTGFTGFPAALLGLDWSSIPNPAVNAA